jgi:cytidylate kinase
MMTMQKKTHAIITLDGPAGTGKGTISRLLAKQLGWHYLDSGALFRILAYSALTHQLDLSDEAALSALAHTLNISFEEDKIFLYPASSNPMDISGKEITQEIRTETVGNAASSIATLPCIRTLLAHKQRDFYQPPGLIADGRDMGTTIFPHAMLKFFLDASIEERAKRRHTQLKNAGIDASLPEILSDIELRDMRDKTRTASPLVPAPDAILIDTTTLSIDEVFAKVYGITQNLLKNY